MVMIIITTIIIHDTNNNHSYNGNTIDNINVENNGNNDNTHQ